MSDPERERTTTLRHPVTNQDVEVDTRTGRIVGRKDPADIVERLRDPRYMHPPRSMLEEAADEIERLREEVAGCTWRLDNGDEGDWETSCGERFVILAGTPGENHMRFCCYCGGALKEAVDAE